MSRFTRRQFVAGSLTVGAASLAGCISPTVDQPEPYAEWLPAKANGTVTAYLDFTLSEETSQINPVLPLVVPGGGGDDGGNLAPTLSNIEDIDDPLLTFPLETGGRVLAGGFLTLAVVGLGDLVDPNRPEFGMTEVFFADGTTVGMGDLDAEAVGEGLTTGPERTRFERVGERGDFTLYAFVEGDDGFAAVSESTVVVANSRERVERVLATRLGGHKNAAAADDTFGNLLDATDTGHVLVGWDGPVDLGTFTLGDGGVQSAGGVVEEADDVVSSVRFDPAGGELTANLALEAASRVDESRLEQRLGAASADRSLSIDGSRVTASGTYTEETVDLDFVADEASTTTTAPRGDDVPTKVAKAVPDGAFEFTFLAETEQVRVDFTADIDADEVALKSVESGFETSSSTPGVIEYLNVSVNPDGDTVLVIVTVDDESGVVARYEVP
jgi:hypothetical protein